MPAASIQSKYAPLIGIDQFGDGGPTAELQYWNYGLWDRSQADPKIAAENLVGTLLRFLPPPPASILDVGFGQGASVHELCRRYGCGSVTGVNIASDQVEHARASGLTCDLHVMDAARLDFPSESFDGILCVEAAFHFNSRTDFLARAHSVLKPGGRLVMSDFLMRDGIGLDPGVFPPGNIVSGLDDYRSAFVNAGFAPEDLRIDITTDRQLVPFLARMAELAGYLPSPDPDIIRIHEEHSRVAISFILTRLLNIGDTAIVIASKGQRS